MVAASSGLLKSWKLLINNEGRILNFKEATFSRHFKKDIFRNLPGSFHQVFKI